MVIEKESLPTHVGKKVDQAMHLGSTSLERFSSHSQTPQATPPRDPGPLKVFMPDPLLIAVYKFKPQFH
jgi:hypothetical protein